MLELIRIVFVEKEQGIKKMLQQIEALSKKLTVDKLLVGLALVTIWMTANAVEEQVATITNTITGLISANISLGDWFVLSFNFTFGSQ